MSPAASKSHVSHQTPRARPRTAWAVTQHLPSRLPPASIRPREQQAHSGRTSACMRSTRISASFRQEARALAASLSPASASRSPAATAPRGGYPAFACHALAYTPAAASPLSSASPRARSLLGRAHGVPQSLSGSAFLHRPPLHQTMSSKPGRRRNAPAAARTDRRFDRRRPDGTGGMRGAPSQGNSAMQRPARPGAASASRGKGALVSEIMHHGGVKNLGLAQQASSAAGRVAEVAVVWFRNDLRLRDNPVLAASLSSQFVLPIYCFDPRAYEDSMYGYQKTGEHRAFFVQQAVEDLRRSLRERGCDLIVRQGHPEDVLQEMIALLFENGVQTVSVFAQKDVAWEETRVERAVESSLAELQGDIVTTFLWNSTMLDPGSLPYSSLSEVPDVFSTFRRDVERDFQVASPLPIPEHVPGIPLGMMIKPGKLPELGNDLNVRNLADPTQQPFAHPKAAIDFKGGETAAWDRVQEWIWDQSSLKDYKEIRNGSGANECSSKFSVFLASGCISAKEIWWQVQKYEQEVVSNESTYWLIFELLWRDYFRFNAANQGNSIFSKQGPQKNDYWAVSMTPANQDRIDRWRQGLTGVPFVDSHMRELDKTGYMSNRGRQVVASYFIHDVKAGDWRIGAEYFENKLIDYDPCSNWCNWAYLAGVGNDPRGLRRFNPYKQAQQYDPDAEFIIKWCPELYRIPLPEIYCPHVLSDEELDAFALQLVDAKKLKDKVGEPIAEGTVQVPAIEGEEDVIVAPRDIHGYPRPMANAGRDLKALKLSRPGF